ncbi:MAG: 5-(carboxyamino)imidazole ribonucleotide synthase [Oscillospiraceae bacterium]|nr:5-(carboxyamino)imidazole ribonucleotide synthase [Oscillospiraceae bacterium]
MNKSTQASIKKRIGIVGGGQLGKMMILEAKRLGYQVAVIDPAGDCPASSICDHLIVAPLDDPKAYPELAKYSDVITYESEHIDTAGLAALEQEGYNVYPSVKALTTIQNKFLQKTALQKGNIPVPEFSKVTTTDDIREMGKPENFGYPLMLKATRGGYDGKGNAFIKTEADIERAYNELGGGKVELMVEAFLDFEKEISFIVCRGINGERAVYPIAENTHANSVLDTTAVPAKINKSIEEKATNIADAVMSIFDGVGTFCVEMFVGKDGEVYVNEVAPRPHNSGHYTIEACFSDQFENHIRAIVGLPFGSTKLMSPVVMVNLLGQSDGVTNLVGLNEAYENPNVRVHLYGKSESRIARKMGHYTVIADTVDKAMEQAQALKSIVRVEGE